MFPYSWIIRLLAVSEYETAGPEGRYNMMLGPPGQEKRLGVIYLEAFAMQSESYWIGYGFIYICGVTLSMFIIYTMGMHYLRLGAVRPIISKKTKKRTLFKDFRGASNRYVCVYMYVCVCVCTDMCVYIYLGAVRPIISKKTKKRTLFKDFRGASNRYVYMYVCVCVCTDMCVCVYISWCCEAYYQQED